MPAIQKTWKSLSVVQRATLVVILAAVFGGVLAVASFAGRPSYGVLFSNLDPEDAGAVTGKLRDLKVDYRLAQEGRAIEVPQDKVLDLRNTLAVEGLPRGGSVGFELFDKASFGATDFTQHLNYRRGLEGELSRTIDSIDGVASSRVHIAIPEKRLFSEQEEAVKASVMLRLKPGRQMSERQVGGIVHMVSSAVEGLKPDDVSVLDDRGDPLTTTGAGATSNLTDNQVQLQERYENRLARELQKLADEVLGPDKCAIRVSADLDWDQTETTSEKYTPGGPGSRDLPTQQTVSSESYSKTDAGAGPRGVPGPLTTGTGLPAPPAANRAGVQPNANAGAMLKAGPGQYLKTETKGQFAVNKEVVRTVTAPGKVRRLSVAVLLDSSAKVGPAQQDALKNAFAAGAGLDTTPVTMKGRGDRIELVPMAFDRSAEKQASAAADSASKDGFRSELIRNVAAIAIVVLIALASLFILRRSRNRPQLDVLLADDGPQGLLAPGAAQSVQPVPTMAVAGVDARALPALDRVRTLASERPEDVARHIQTWMTE